MEEMAAKIHEMIKEAFPDAVSVTVFVNIQGVEITPAYRTNVSGYSMQTITGSWVRSDSNHA